MAIVVCYLSPQPMLFQMLETGFTDLSFRALAPEISRRHSDAREEVRERIAGFLAIGIVMAVPLYGVLSGPDFTWVEESEAAEAVSTGAGITPPRVNIETVFNRLETNELTRAEIRDVQAQLKAKGFEPGPLDGVAGKRTLAALNAYRQSIRLAPALAVSRETISPLTRH